MRSLECHIPKVYPSLRQIKSAPVCCRGRRAFELWQRFLPMACAVVIGMVLFFKNSRHNWRSFPSESFLLIWASEACFSFSNLPFPKNETRENSSRGCRFSVLVSAHADLRLCRARCSLSGGGSMKMTSPPAFTRTLVVINPPSSP